MLIGGMRDYLLLDSLVRGGRIETNLAELPIEEEG